MTADNSSVSLLRKLVVDSKDSVTLPKYVIVKDEESGHTASIPTSILTPTMAFNVEDCRICFKVTKSEIIEQVADSDSSDCNSSFCSEASHPEWNFLFQEEVALHSDILQDFEESVCSNNNEQNNSVDDEENINEGGHIIENDNVSVDNVMQSVLQLMPSDFQPGDDNLGSKTIVQRRAASYFNKPWQFTDSEIQTFIHISKKDFLILTLTCVDTGIKSVAGLNIFASCFLMLFKLANQVSFDTVATLFCLPTKSSAFDVFYKQVLHQYKSNCNIPTIIFNNEVNESELSKLYTEAYRRTPVFYKVLLKDFEDPSGQDRIPVAFNIDGTYLDIQGSEDAELQKHMYYQPRASHVAKLICLTDLTPKFIGLLPIASSQTPSSGDGLLTSKHIEIEDSKDGAHYLRTLLGGNEEFFVILICDTGFVMDVPNAPVQSKGPNSVNLASVCKEINCVLLHTSSRYEKFHIEKTSNNKLRVVEWEPGKPSLSENRIKFVRLLRKAQEQIHAALKQRFKFLDMRHLWNSTLLPFTKKKLDMYGMPEEYKDTPKINFLVTVCCSLINEQHPGFPPLSLEPAAEVRTANIIHQRLFLENPFLHPEIWPIDFTNTRPGLIWTEITVKDLQETCVINFPQLEKGQINSIALELLASTHALQKADGILTYMKQLLIKDMDLTREEAIEELKTMPGEWKIQYLELKAPSDFHPTSDCPRWAPTWWNERFGPWHDITLVRCKIPPSNRSATSANFHWPVIAFGQTPSRRLMVRPPYNVIYFSHCFRCPSKSGSISMDRHEAALLKILSFPEEYRPTSKTVNILNTVAQPKRQMTKILPDMQQSKDIPLSVPRRSRNTRFNRNGSFNPLYPTPHQIIPNQVNNAETSNIGVRHPAVVATTDEPAASNMFSERTTEVQSSAASPDTHDLDNTEINVPASYENVLQQFLRITDPNNMVSIPEETVHSLDFSHQFSILHLQLPGLVNDGNICALLSFVLSLHRIGLKLYIKPTDLPSMVLKKILCALPSPYSFSLQSFIEACKHTGSTTSIQSGYTDVLELAETILSHLELMQTSCHIPPLTKFFGTFKCLCCGDNWKQVPNWDGQIGSTLPLLPIPDSEDPVHVETLFDTYLKEPFETRCRNETCRSRISNGKLDPVLGKFTIVGLNRFHIDNQNSKRMTKICLADDMEYISPLLGELVSIICHRGDPNEGHYISYHQVNGSWFMNDDSKKCKLVSNPLVLNDSVASETAELLFFQNIS